MGKLVRGRDEKASGTRWYISLRAQVDPFRHMKKQVIGQDQKSGDKKC